MNTKVTGLNSALSTSPNSESRSPIPALPPQLFRFGALLAAMVLTGLAMSSPIGQRTVISFGLLGIIFALLVWKPDTGLIFILVFSAFIGGMRRALIPFWDYSPNDPFLIVVPLALTLCLSMFLMQRRITLDTLLSKRLRWLFLWMSLEIVNPLQGSPVVGVAGALFYLVPLMWFFLGRQIGNPAMINRIFRCTLIIAVLGGLYGLKQTWFGFADVEMQWMALTKFGQKLGTVPRPFSFFTNGGEYAVFCSLGIVTCWAAWLHGKRVALAPVPLLLLALIMTSYRSALLAMLLACSAVWAVYGRNPRLWMLRGSLALVIGIAGTIWSLQQAKDADAGGSSNLYLSYQTKGLTDVAHSSAGNHQQLVVNGVSGSFTAPLGHGLGYTTLAAVKYGGEQGNTEFDISNMFVTLGPSGGIFYLVIMGTTFKTLFQYWRRTRQMTALILVGVAFELPGTLA